MFWPFWRLRPPGLFGCLPPPSPVEALGTVIPPAEALGHIVVE